MACHRRCPHLFVSGQMLSEKGRAFPKAQARPVHTHPLSHNHLLQRSFCPLLLPSYSPPSLHVDVARKKNDTNWKWLGKPWKRTIKLLPPPPPPSLLAAGFALQPAHKMCTPSKGDCGPWGGTEKPFRHETRYSTAACHAGGRVVYAATVQSGSLQLLFRVLA